MIRPIDGMRILLITSEVMDMHTERLVQMLLNAQYQVILLARDNPLTMGNENFRFLRYRPFHLSDWFRPYRLRKLLIERVNAMYLWFVWMKVRPDIVHTIYVGQGAYYCALARLSPLVFTALGSDINDAFERNNPAWQARVTKTLLAADYLTADTPEVLQRCTELTGRSLPSGLFYFGIDLELFKHRSTEETLPLRQKLEIPRNAKIILSPRRLTHKMKHDIVLQAFSDYLQSIHGNAFLIFRKFGFFSIQVEKDLKTLASGLGVQNQVIFVDEMPYEELPLLYSLADVIVNVPEQDGLPVTLFEASACQVPVITSNLSSYQEFLDKGNYICVDVGDIKGLTVAMKRVLGDRNTKLKAALKINYELILQVADEKQNFSNLENIYRLTREKATQGVL